MNKKKQKKTGSNNTQNICDKLVTNKRSINQLKTSQYIKQSLLSFFLVKLMYAVDYSSRKENCNWSKSVSADRKKKQTKKKQKLKPKKKLQ